MSNKQTHKYVSSIKNQQYSSYKGVSVFKSYKTLSCERIFNTEMNKKSHNKDVGFFNQIIIIQKFDVFLFVIIDNSSSIYVVNTQ